MNENRVQWQQIVHDLALHLGSASNLEQLRRILDDAERDLSRVAHPPDFWERLESEYDRVNLLLDRTANQTVQDLNDSARAFITAKRRME